MSIIDSFEDITIVSHEIFVKSLYEAVKLGDSFSSFSFKTKYFSTVQPYKQIGTKNTKCRQKEMLDSVAVTISSTHERYKARIQDRLLKSGLECSTMVEEEEVENSVSNNEFIGGNITDNSIVVPINGDSFLIPPQCRFFNFNVKDISNHVRNLHDLIILDPPWWNKYIRRKRARNANDGYSMMWNHELAEIPVNSFLERDGLVVVWCTNAQSHIDAVKKEIFPKWGVEYVAEWFWLKVTQKGEAITPYSPTNGKQPFERILFGCRRNRTLRTPESGKIITSVPSTIHSHKPPLCNVLEPYLPAQPRGLEIFARYLLPYFTSYGNQVLKFQHLRFYDKL